METTKPNPRRVYIRRFTCGCCYLAPGAPWCRDEEAWQAGCARCPAATELLRPYFERPDGSRPPHPWSYYEGLHQRHLTRQSYQDEWVELSG